MNPDHPADPDTSAAGDQAPLDPQRAPEDDVYVFFLYIAGMGERSRRAVANMTTLCDRYLAGRYELTVIDLYQQPELALGEPLITAPMVIKKLPPPRRQVIGDLAQTDKVMLRLKLRRDT